MLSVRVNWEISSLVRASIKPSWPNSEVALDDSMLRFTLELLTMMSRVIKSLIVNMSQVQTIMAAFESITNQQISDFSIHK